jgi:hypothetical protein
MDLVYNLGFNSVYTSGFPIPQPVIIIVHDLDTGSFALGTFSFIGPVAARRP